ncbi:MAG: porin family protein [Chitinophagales bacterium]|nr:porin family protein [Chitinophagales bacterium]
MNTKATKLPVKKILRLILQTKPSNSTRKNLVLLLTVLMFTHFRAAGISDRVRIGLAATPGIAWCNPVGKDLDKGAPRFGIGYGVQVEYWFARNYGLLTGLEGGFDGCNIRNRDLFALRDSAGSVLKNINEKYAFHYLQLPVYLKLKTNPIRGGKFSVWGQVGTQFAFTVNARATFSDPIFPAVGAAPVVVEKENILRASNEVTRIIPKFRSGFADVRLGAGAGFEYAFDDKASLLCGMVYHNGFINNLLDRDPKKEPNLMRFFGLRLGVLF